jgi:hypothetical protein
LQFLLSALFRSFRVKTVPERDEKNTKSYEQQSAAPFRFGSAWNEKGRACSAAIAIASIRSLATLRFDPEHKVTSLQVATRSASSLTSRLFLSSLLPSDHLVIFSALRASVKHHYSVLVPATRYRPICTTSQSRYTLESLWHYQPNCRVASPFSPPAPPTQF